MGDVHLKDGILTAEPDRLTTTGTNAPPDTPHGGCGCTCGSPMAMAEMIFESGAVDETAIIQGNDNDADPAQYEPHYHLIYSPDQVQIYEAIMQNTEEEVTTTLLLAAGYVKDNRLLPSGFPVDNPPRHRPLWRRRER